MPDPALDPEPTPAGPTLDEIFLEVGREVWGFAGIFVDSDGAIAIQLVDTLQGHAAREAIERVFGREPGLRGKPTRLLAVRYSFEQLRSWRDTLYERGLPGGIQRVDLDERSNLIRVGTTDALAAEAVRTRARELGIPESAIVAEVVPSFRPLTDFLGSRIRPVLGGLTIFTYSGCTLGFKAKKTGTTRYIIANAHCTATFGQVDGDSVWQPQVHSIYYVGTEVTDPPFVTGGGCPTGYICRHADAALVQCDTLSACSQYTIARTTFEYTGSDTTQNGSFELTPEPWFVVGERSNASLIQGTALSKVGQISGWTGGTIVQTCLDSYAGPKVLRCQFTVSAVSRGGDSGSPVFSYESSTGKAWLAGILWGSGPPFIFSPISGVKTDLGAMTVYSIMY